MSARIVDTFVVEADVSGGVAEEGVPDGGGETSVRWCGCNKVSIL